ncbi:MAG: hypothetical protein RLY93_12115 [Sumerlaeia bacterium]
MTNPENAPAPSEIEAANSFVEEVILCGRDQVSVRDIALREFADGSRLIQAIRLGRGPDGDPAKDTLRFRVEVPPGGEMVEVRVGKNKLTLPLMVFHRVQRQRERERTANFEAGAPRRMTYQGGQAHCDRTLYPMADGRLLAIFTERPDNQGRSVTHAIEELAASTARELGLAGENLVIVEHYPPESRARGEDESYDEVALTWSTGPDGHPKAQDPRWRHRGPAWMRNLLAEHGGR